MAPATESTAPREASDTAAALNAIPMFARRAVSANRATAGRDGARSSAPIRSAAGRRRRAALASRTVKPVNGRTFRNRSTRRGSRGPWARRALGIEFIAPA